MYRIEVLEDKLKATPTGRRIAAVFAEHVHEVMLLINHNRQVTVTWHRNHGPEFIGSAVKSGFEENFQVVREIEGVTLVQLLRRMASALQDVATPGLKKAIGEHYALVLHWAQQFSSLQEVLDEIARIDRENAARDN